MGLPTQAQSTRGIETAPFSVKKISNGYEITRSWESKTANGSSYEYDYVSESYAFPTLDEALAKVKELSTPTE